MATMRPFKGLTLLGLSPFVVHAHVCRVSPLHASQEGQCPAAYSTGNSTGPTFTYRIAAAFSGKHTRFDARRDLYAHPPASLAHRRRPNGKPFYNSGQDAFFVTSVGAAAGDEAAAGPGTAHVAFGVADGVGGWEAQGVDPADFSHGLCGYMEARARAAAHRVSPWELLEDGYADLVEDPSVTAGGSTACVAVGRPDGALELANLGDSGFVQLRPHAVAYASPPQTRAFNTPFQLSLIPPEVRRRDQLFGGSHYHDMPADAARTEHQVQHGDVLVIASDGVWDNLDAGDVLGIVGRQMTGFGAWKASSSGDQGKAAAVGNEKGALEAAPGTLAELTAEGGLAAQEKTMQAALAVAIAGEAKAASVDTRRESPFARELKRYYPRERYTGGKVDDICVVVAVVVQDDADA